MTEHIDLLRDLCLAPGPTGFEAPAQEVFRRRLAPLGEASGDPLGNVWLSVGPERARWWPSSRTPTRSASS